MSTISQQDSRVLGYFSSVFTLVTDSQDIKEVLKDCLGDSKARRFYHNEGVTGLMVLYGDAEVLEVWATCWSAPFSKSAVYDHIWVNNGGIGEYFL
jgi:hypothetical protein